jgi:hypothetical protein
MTQQMNHTPVDSLEISTVSPLQGAAWAAWNASYYAETPEPYQIVSRLLYQQDIHERITHLFARLDAQNAHLDTIGCRSGDVEAAA